MFRSTRPDWRGHSQGKERSRVTHSVEAPTESCAAALVVVTLP